MESNRNIKARNREFEINDPNDPFKDDKLGRKEYAEVLTDVVELFADGAVVALNGAWGTGKTTFLKMWSQHLKNQDVPVVYYNAWEDDICNEPLMSMLRGLKVLDKGDEFDKVLRNGAKVLVGALSGALTAAAGVFGDVAKGAVEGGMKQLEDSVYESLKEDDDRMALLQSFKNSLTDYMTVVCDKGKPLVYMVDELDRCNPTFAVKVLERIKHLFDVPNVVFVLSIDKKQLACSVKGFYGSNEIDAEEYLRRFIDIDYYLPEPNAELFCEYLYDYYDFDEFLRNKLRIAHDYGGKRSEKAVEDKNDMLYMAKTLVKYKHLSLRQIERVLANVRIALCSMHINNEWLPQFFLVLSYIRVCDSDTFRRIADFKMSIQEYVDVMEQIITHDMLFGEDAWYNFHYLMSVALSCYYEGCREFYKKAGMQIADLYGKDGKLALTFNIFDYDSVSNNMSACRFNKDVVNISSIIQKLRLYEKLAYQDDSNFELPKVNSTNAEKILELYKQKP